MPDFSFCPQCNTKYRTAGMPAFKRLRCKKCLGIFVVPEDAPDPSRDLPSRDREGAVTPLADARGSDADARGSDEKDAEHAIPAGVGDQSTLARAKFKGGVTLVPSPPWGEGGALAPGEGVTQDTLEGLPRPIEKKIEATLKPSATDEKYVVEGEIARGGMGVILRAGDRDIRRPVAMKVMLDAKSSKDKARFVEEAQVTGQLEHPNIVPIHELGIDAEGRLFFTMKLVKGRSLKEVLDGLRPKPKSRKPVANSQQPIAGVIQEPGAKSQEPMSLGRLLNAFISICNAMAFAHAKGVVHRDLKPANIMLGDYGEVLVMDWGLAKPGAARPRSRTAKPSSGVIEAGTGDSEDADGADQDSRDRELADAVRSLRQETGGSMTMDGTIIGTPHYMPPEQADGKIEEIDAPITMKALARSKGDRYQRVEDLRRDIELFIEGRAVSAKEDTFAESVVKLVKRNKGATVATAVGLAAVMAVVGAGYWLNLQEKRRAEAEADKARIARDDANSAKTEAERQRDNTTKAYEELKAARYAQEKAEVAKRTLEDKAAAESRREWHLAFEENFSMAHILERAPLEAELRTADAGTEGEVAPETPAALARRWVESRWEIVGGTWELKNGELRLLAGKAAWMILKKPMPGDVKIEFDCHQESDRLNDISCFMNAPPREKWPAANTNQAPGYHFKYGGWFNTRNALELGTRTVFTQDAKPVVRGKTYHVKAERMGKRLVLTVDDKVIYDVQDPQPPDLGPEHGVAGLYASTSESWFNNIKVYTLGSPRRIDILDLAEDYARKGNCTTAHDLFQDILDSDNDPARLDQARDGIARCVGTLELPSYKAKLAQAWPDVKYTLELKAYGLLLDISKSSLSDLSALAGMKLAALNLDASKVTDLSPLKGMPLATLNCANLKLKDLEALRGLKLRKLECQNNEIKSLEPLKGMPLAWLTCTTNKLATLEPLRGMSLTRLECNGNQVKSLEPLKGLPLTWLNCSSCGLTSLDPLRGMGLARLECQDNPIASLEPLSGMPVSSLNICRTKVAGLAGLRELPALKSVDLTYTPERDAAALQPLKTLETINGVPVADFWASDTTSQIYCFVGSGFAGSVHFLPDGKRLVSGHSDGSIKLWVAETGKLIHTMRGNPAGVMGIVLSSDGKRAFAGGSEKSWRLWDIETGKEIRHVEKIPQRPNGVALSPDGTRALTTNGEGNDVRLWDVESGKEIRKFDGHTKQAWDVAFSPDGKTVYSTSDDNTLRSWGAETGTLLKRFDARTGVRSLILVKNGAQALVGCGDGSLRLIDLAKNVEIRRFTGHSKIAWGVALSPDGKRVLSGSEDTSLRLWDLETGKQIRRFHRGNGGLTGVAFSPDGRLAAAASSDGTVRVWTMPAPDADGPAKAR
ncbi:MAG: protein kinase [Planctomycetota bacterium]|nr:protein kinase [Planctomycetota bacterium]